MIQLLNCFILAAFVFCGACAAPAAAKEPRAGQSRQANEDAGNQAKNAPAKLDAQSSVGNLLDALHDAGTDLHTLSSRIILTDIDATTGEETRRPGKVFLRKDEDGVKFRAVLIGVFTDEEMTKIRPEKIEYLLIGDELIDRNYKTKTAVHRKLPPEQAEMDLLKLGEGPFPLPIGQSKEEVHRLFEVTEVNPADPNQNAMAVPAEENTRRLHLVPKEGTSLADDFSWIEIDVSLETGLPEKVITLDNLGTGARITDLRQLQINAELPEDTFKLEEIDKGQWNVIYEELGE